MYNDLQLRAFTQIAYIDLESKYNYYIANNSLVEGLSVEGLSQMSEICNSPFFTCLHLVYK